MIAKKNTKTILRSVQKMVNHLEDKVGVIETAQKRTQKNFEFAEAKQQKAVDTIVTKLEDVARRLDKFQHFEEKLHQMQHLMVLADRNLGDSQKEELIGLHADKRSSKMGSADWVDRIKGVLGPKFGFHKSDDQHMTLPQHAGVGAPGFHKSQTISPRSPHSGAFNAPKGSQKTATNEGAGSAPGGKAGGQNTAQPGDGYQDELLGIQEEHEGGEEAGSPFHRAVTVQYQDGDAGQLGIASDKGKAHQHALHELRQSAIHQKERAPGAED